MKTFLKALIGSFFALALSVSVLQAQTAVPAILAFGASPNGSAAPTQVVTFTNTSTATLGSLTVASSGGNSGDFGVVTNPATNCGGSLTAGSVCTVTVTFTPGAVGARSSTLAFAWTGGSLNVVESGAGLAVATYQNCGTATACNPSTYTPLHAVGRVTFSASTTVTVTGMPSFSGVTFYACTVTDTASGHGTYTWTVQNVSATSFTITSGTSNSDLWFYSCDGF